MIVGPAPVWPEEIRIDLQKFASVLPVHTLTRPHGERFTGRGARLALGSVRRIM